MIGTRGWSLLVAGLLGTVLGPPAGAGVEMTTEVTDLGAKGRAAPVEAHTFIDGDRVRMETKARSAMIFRGDRDLMWVLQPKQHAYFEVTKATMTEVQGRAEQAMAQMKAQLDKLPPEQRAQVEKLMNEHRPAGAPAAPAQAAASYTLRPTGRSDAVSGVACRELEVLRGATKESEVCVADWGATGIARGDLAAFGKLGTWQDGMRGSASAAMGDASPAESAMLLLEKMDGVPLRVRSFHGGAPTTEMRVTKIEKKSVDPGLFEVPAGYTRKNPARDR